MKSKYSDNEIKEWGIFLVDNKTTLKITSECYGVPLSSLHNKLHQVLSIIQPNLYNNVCNQLKENAERTRFKKWK
jgi:hypothetical protein